MKYLATTDPSPSKGFDAETDLAIARMRLAREFPATDGWRTIGCKMELDSNGKKYPAGLPVNHNLIDHHPPGAYIKVDDDGFLGFNDSLIAIDTDSATTEKMVAGWIETGLIPRPWRFHSTGKGFHRIYLKDDSLNIRCNELGIDVIDLAINGIFLPPTWHPEVERCYEVVHVADEKNTLDVDALEQLINEALAFRRGIDSDTVVNDVPPAEDAKNIAGDDWDAIEDYATRSGIKAGESHQEVTIFRLAWFLFYKKGWRGRERITKQCLTRNKHPYPSKTGRALPEKKVVAVANSIGYANRGGDPRIKQRRGGVVSSRLRREKRIPKMVEMKRMLDDGLTKTAVAKELGVDRKTIGRWSNTILGWICTDSPADGVDTVLSGGVNTVLSTCPTRKNPPARSEVDKLILRWGCGDEYRPFLESIIQGKRKARASRQRRIKAQEEWLSNLPGRLDRVVDARGQIGQFQYDLLLQDIEGGVDNGWTGYRYRWTLDQRERICAILQEAC